MTATLNDLRIEQWLRRREHGEILWKTKTGELIDIRKMSDQHLENTIRFLEKNSEYDELSFDYDAENFGDR